MVLAVTKMLSGMCLGGISVSTGEWIRPVKEFGTILPGDLTYPDGSHIQPFDVVELTLGQHRPKPPHVEDWICDFVKSRPRFIENLPDEKRRAFLEKHVEPNAMEELNAGRRSLCLLEAQKTQALFKLDSYSGKYEARMYFPDLDHRPAAVTDVKWRALGRSLTKDSERVVLRGEQLLQTVGAEAIWPAVGLSRLHEGRYWPLIIGVHCLPDYEAEVDYGEL